MSPDLIDRWGIIQLYSAAFKKNAWIECICLGYTMIEMGLHYLLHSKAKPSGEPCPEQQIDKCRYLIELAALARDEGILPPDIYSRIESFNELRRKAIHRLLSGQVTKSELESASKMIGPIYGDIQALWLKLTVGLEETYNPKVHGD